MGAEFITIKSDRDIEAMRKAGWLTAHYENSILICNGEPRLLTTMGE